jgi:hypothetical protein
MQCSSTSSTSCSVIVLGSGVWGRLLNITSCFRQANFVFFFLPHLPQRDTNPLCPHFPNGHWRYTVSRSRCSVTEHCSPDPYRGSRPHSELSHLGAQPRWCQHPWTPPFFCSILALTLLYNCRHFPHYQET